MIKRMTDKQIGGFFTEAKTLLANAKEGIEIVNTDYPQVVIEAISYSVDKIEVDSFISIEDTKDTVGEEDAGAAIEMLIEQVNESLAQYKGEAVLGGTYNGDRIVSIKFRT